MSQTPKVQLVHPTGNANVRQVLRLITEKGALAEFNTSISWRDDSLWGKLLPVSLRRQMRRRQFDVDSRKVVTDIWPEVARLLAARIGGKRLQTRYSVDAIYRSLDRKVAHRLDKTKPDTLYSYEDGAEFSFMRAKELGIRCVYDLPIAFWKTSFALMEEECERYPEWARTMSGRIASSEKLARKDHEIALADHVVCPSRFVYNSLPEDIRSSKSCTIARFGCFTESDLRSRPTPESGPLRVLFVGNLTQRKGLADVFSAFKMVDRADLELVVLGSLQAPIEFYKGVFPDFQYEAPRPHDEVLKLMSSCDLFLLPSIVEGRALVQLEALGIGLPLIVTPNTGGEDLIQPDGQTGFSVPIRSPESIAEKLSWFADNRESLDAMKDACIRHAASLTWESYRQMVASAIFT